MHHIFLGFNNGYSKYEANAIACMAAESESELTKFADSDRHRSSGGNPFVNPPPPGLFLYPPQPGGSDPIPPPLLSRKRMHVERRARRHSKDLDETLPNHFLKFNIEVTCQVKVRSNVKIGCFQVADRSDLKRSIFRPKLSICTPKNQAKVLCGEIVSYLSQVKVRSEKVTKPKIFKCVVSHMFYVPFWTKNSIVTVILQFDLI